MTHPTAIQENESPLEKITAAGIPVYLSGFSAIDSYLGKKSGAAVHALCTADLADLARLFEDLRYPGAALANAAVDSGGKTWYFRCEDMPANTGLPFCGLPQSAMPPLGNASFGFLEFYRDCKNGRYYDPNGLYPQFRRLRDGAAYRNAAPEHNAFGEWHETAGTQAHPRRILGDGALILARYFPETASRKIGAIAEKLRSACRMQDQPGEAPGTEEQRQLLVALLEAENPAAGFELLNKTGYIPAWWPELAMLDEVDHSKEYHPEGNVWKHTLEALRHRKAASGGFDLRLSLGLLLHDAGKPLSKAAGSRRFDGHAELGVRQARRFLERLGFDSALSGDVCYLVRNHMLTAALPRLPLARTGEIMASPLFPLLLELYRCDEASSFKGLDGYYQSSAAYRNWLKYRRNPYHSIPAASYRQY